MRGICLGALAMAGLLVSDGARAQATVSPSWSELQSSVADVAGRRWEVKTLKGRLVASDGTVRQHQGTVWVYTPAAIKTPGVVLGLPGWKFAARTWEDKARISDHAESLGVVVALADMHTTVYESDFYPQTRSDRKWCGSGCTMPGSPWVGEVVLPYLAGTVGPVRGVFGLSTGGRGAVLVPQLYPGLGIPRACSLSGTFDLASLEPGTGEYKIHANVYGSRKDHLERWQADDSLRLVEALDTMAVLLIHGTADPYVPVTQSASLAEAMHGRDGSVRFVPVEGGGHDWTLWSGYLRPCLEFLVERKE